MPLLFVHGVNVRDNAGYYQDVKVRDGLFQKFALDAIAADSTQALIENPYWGKYGATFSWSHASLPEGEYQAFGSGADVFEEIVAEISPGTEAAPDRFLLVMARESLVKAVDVVWAASAHTKPDTSQSIAEALSALGWKAINYAESNPDTAWLQTISNDNQFIDKLLQEVQSWQATTKEISKETEVVIESFGINDIWDHVKTAATNLGTAIANLPQKATGMVSVPLVNLVRPKAHRRFSLFLGDIFVYLTNRGKKGAEGEIVKTVADAFQRASESKKPGIDDQLVIIAHSMGGNITYDILTHFRPEIACDVLVTVGSQVGLFEELKLFHASDKKIPSASQKLVAKPSNIKRWLNVFDPIDVLGYSIERIFADTSDYEFITDTSLLSAHGMYFYRPSFHKRLRERIKGS